MLEIISGWVFPFQSPRSGKFESNNATHTFKTVDDLEDDSVSIP